MPASARRSASWRRRFPTSWSRAATCGSTISISPARLALLAEMSKDARALVEPGARGAPVTERRLAYMRYVGQGHEITVPLPVRDLTADDAAALRETFEREYSVLFRRPIPGAAIEALSWSVLVSTQAQRPAAIAPARPSSARRRRTAAAPSSTAARAHHRRAALSARAHGGGRARAGPGDHRRGRDLDLRRPRASTRASTPPGVS